MKKHYDPYSYNGTSGPEGDGEYYCVEYDNYVCGTKVNHDEDIEVTNRWEYVTCKRCLKQKDKINEHIKKEEEAIVNDMGQMAEYFKEELKEKRSE